MLPLNHINDNSSKSNQMCLFQILDGEFPLRSVSSRMPRQIVGKAWNVRWLGRTKDPEEEWRFDWKGDERKGYTFAFASTTRLRQRLTAIRNPHETFRNSVTRLRSGSFLFFSFTQLLCTLPRDRRFFDCTNFTWKHWGTEERRETWSGKRSTTRTSLLRYLSIFHFEFYSIIGGVRARVAATTTWISIIRIARGELPRSWQVHRWWLNR